MDNTEDSSMVTLGTRIPLQLKKDIDAAAEQQGLTLKDWIVKSFLHYLSCSKASNEPIQRKLINIYPDCYCSKCKQKIPVGAEIIWAKNERGTTVYICENCQIEAMGDKTLLKKHRTILEKEKILKQQDIEIKKNFDLMAEEEERMRQNKVIESLFESFCREAREGNAIPKDLVYEAIEVLRDLKDLKFKEYAKQEPEKTSFNGANVQNPCPCKRQSAEKDE